jgi:transcriptional regulator with XRE-family HTH domain
MPPLGPTVHRRQLGAELRRLREAAGLTIEAAAKALDSSQPRISRIETGKGRYVLKPTDVRTLCELYSVTDERKIEALVSMLTVSQQRGWWEDYESVLPSGLEVYVGLESDARAERGCEPTLVHGLLQTADYARTVLLIGGQHRPRDVDDLLQVRIERQKLLTREESPLELWAILDEAVIRRPLGGTSVMREQLRHLTDMSEMPNVTIQVIPLSASGGHPGLAGPFSILEFEDDSPVVYVESQAGNLYLEKKADIRMYTGMFDLLRAMALAPVESAALLRATAEEME